MSATTDPTHRIDHVDRAAATGPASPRDRVPAATEVEPIIRARGVSVTLGDTPALCDADLDVSAGEVVALVGPNGAGKSTLLAVLAGDLTPDRGEVVLDGSPLDELRVADAARIRAVQVQETRLSFAFTVIDVVRMGRSPWRRTPFADADDAVVDQAMSTTETSAYATRRVPTLSGGEKARTSFARAIAQETAVLMLDEPTAAMDIRHQEAVLGQARARAGAGVAVVVVLHDLSLAAAYADRIVLLDRGRIRGDGPPAEVLVPDLLEEVYQHPVTVFVHDASGDLVVLPLRERRPTRPAGHVLEVER